MWRYGELLAGGMSRGAVRHQVEAGRLGRLGRGVYGCADDETSRLRALFRRLPPGTVAGFHTGALLHRFGAVSDDRVHVIVPPGVSARRIRGVAAHQTVLPVPDAVEIAGIPVRPPPAAPWTWPGCSGGRTRCRCSTFCLRAGACRREDLLTEVTRHAGLRGVRQAGNWVALADPRSECRQESQLRLLLIDGGLPPPEPQLWVSDRDGIPIYRLDLGYRDQRIGLSTTADPTSPPAACTTIAPGSTGWPSTAGACGSTRPPTFTAAPARRRFGPGPADRLRLSRGHPSTTHAARRAARARRVHPPAGKRRGEVRGGAVASFDGWTRFGSPGIFGYSGG
ncbi:type IV toxin-antitoxin system AbiEi family antitoxin domain-containing protein [Micromonospora sp. BRA006-A]|nr:type IV toxin-antitoxin system AbiEi family antitoxin domain-containing protein [Micromonospora sp. BRA006-A]